MRGEVALVTGASRGIGRAIALEFAKQGAMVIVNYLKNHIEAQRTAEEIIQIGATVLLVKADVSNSYEVAEMFRTIKEKFGKIDVLVNNAGILKDNLIVKTEEQDWDAILNVNLKGTYNCLHEATKLMMSNPNGGRIINVTSSVGIYGNAGQTPYCSSKAGVIGLTKAAAKELGEVGIRVNALAPGLTQTDMLDALDKARVEKLVSRTSLRRIAKPEEIAKGALFLATAMSSYVTGQVLVIDGGMVV